MSLQRVKGYSRTMVNYANGTTFIEDCKFTEVQAHSVGAVLHNGSLNIVHAQKLVEQWNRQARHNDLNCSYTLILS